MRDMAIITARDRMVRRLRPRIIMFPHNMTIHAGLGIITKIRQSLRITKRISPDSQQNPDGQAQNNNRPVQWLILKKDEPLCGLTAYGYLFFPQVFFDLGDLELAKVKNGGGKTGIGLTFCKGFVEMLEFPGPSRRNHGNPHGAGNTL